MRPALYGKKNKVGTPPHHTNPSIHLFLYPSSNQSSMYLVVRKERKKGMVSIYEYLSTSEEKKS
jgi:hypothetical protein